MGSFILTDHDEPRICLDSLVFAACARFTPWNQATSTADINSSSIDVWGFRVWCWKPVCVSRVLSSHLYSLKHHQARLKSIFSYPRCFCSKLLYHCKIYSKFYNTQTFCKHDFAVIFHSVKTSNQKSTLLAILLITDQIPYYNKVWASSTRPKIFNTQKIRHLKVH
jgi:hypothetical protein